MTFWLYKSMLLAGGKHFDIVMISVQRLTRIRLWLLKFNYDSRSYFVTFIIIPFQLNCKFSENFQFMSFLSKLNRHFRLNLATTELVLFTIFIENIEKRNSCSLICDVNFEVALLLETLLKLSYFWAILKGFFFFFIVWTASSSVSNILLSSLKLTLYTSTNTNVYFWAVTPL